MLAEYDMMASIGIVMLLVATFSYHMLCLDRAYMLALGAFSTEFSSSASLQAVSAMAINSSPGLVSSALSSLPTGRYALAHAGINAWCSQSQRLITISGALYCIEAIQNESTNHN